MYTEVSYLMGCGTKKRKDNFIADTFLTPQDWEQDITVTAQLLFQIFIYFKSYKIGRFCFLKSTGNVA